MVVLLITILLRPGEEERGGPLTERGGLKGRESPHSGPAQGEEGRVELLCSIRMHGEIGLFFAQDQNFTASSDLSKQKTGHWTDALLWMHKF